MSSLARLRRFLATADHPAARLARSLRRGVRTFHLPAPRLVVVPLANLYLVCRETWAFLLRVLVCEPYFKAFCTRYGRNLRTGEFLHYVTGRGVIEIGDDVTLDGKIDIAFASRFSDRPTLRIGDRTGLGHQCRLVIARAITIGSDCRIAGGVVLFDSSGHPSDPQRRRAGEPPGPEDVKPIVVEDNVWIGMNATIFPGVTLGEGSVVATGSVVMADVPPYTMVAGNPARKVAKLDPPPDSQQVDPTPLHVAQPVP